MIACVALFVSATPDLLDFPPIVVSRLRRRWLFVGPASEQGRLPGMCHQSGMALTSSSLPLGLLPFKEEIHTGLKGKIKRLVWEDEPCDANRSLLRKATASTDTRAGSLSHPRGARAAGGSFCGPFA